MARKPKRLQGGEKVEGPAPQPFKKHEKPKPTTRSDHAENNGGRCYAPKKGGGVRKKKHKGKSRVRPTGGKPLAGNQKGQASHSMTRVTSDRVRVTASPACWR